ncbi:dihydrolipoyl dehydrogenase family protein, partial [Actinomadura sp. HBU206391]|uniref:dihydrolipoyl dehydrogenase family protein n=1 Tax=Actinomadura sp. HBU206391 TaxID=2731692 RepID=UPI00164FFEB8
MDEADVIVVGAGPSGETAAARCADNGLAVTVVERELVGGECAFWGCIPSKALLRPGDALAAARRVPGADQAVAGPLDAMASLAWRDTLTADWDDAGGVSWLDGKKVDFIRGAGRLTGEREVEVETEAGTRRLTARKAVVLATGSTAAVPPIEGLDEVRTWDNRDATGAHHIPEQLLVLGGGSVGSELAQAFRRLGSREVTVVEAMDRLLSHEEAFAGAEVRAAFEAEGIDVLTGAAMTAARRADGDGAVTSTLADGRKISADEILVAVGRHAATGDLGLETIGLEPGRFVDVDERMRATGVAGGWLYAVGDCNGRALFTHMGKYQAKLAADTVLGRQTAASAVVPRVTFTDPQVCAVGPTEEQARNAGLSVRAVTFGTGDVAGSEVQGIGITGTSKLIVDTERQVVIGATFTGPTMQELLHSATVAIVGEVPLDRLRQAVPSFPTVSEVWLYLLERLEH